MNTVNLYRAQQLAISAAIDSGDYSRASDLLRQDLQTFAQPPEVPAQTGHNQTLTPRRKCGIIKAIKRHVRRWKKQQEEGKRMIKDIESSAAALYDGGWRSTDREELISEYDLTEEEATALCEKLREYENR